MISVPAMSIRASETTALTIARTSVCRLGVGHRLHRPASGTFDVKGGPSFDAPPSRLRRTVGLLRTFDVIVAGHERAFGPPEAGGRRVEWYRYGDSNPGPVAENHVS